MSAPVAFLVTWSATMSRPKCVVPGTFLATIDGWSASTRAYCSSYCSLSSAATASYFVQTVNAASVAVVVGSATPRRDGAALLFDSRSASSLVAATCDAVPTTSMVPALRSRPSVRSNPACARTFRFWAVALTR
jgi:hypothetical protein